MIVFGGIRNDKRRTMTRHYFLEQFLFISCAGLLRRFAHRNDRAETSVIAGAAKAVIKIKNALACFSDPSLSQREFHHEQRPSSTKRFSDHSFFQR
ncbi:MAG: hypothetical protein LBB65_01020 [Burkholderiales bacterium]|nr:hypothetical protein [Burkholderiales bacterium]